MPARSAATGPIPERIVQVMMVGANGDVMTVPAAIA